MQTLLDLIFEHIIDRLDQITVPHSIDYEVLQRRLVQLTYTVPQFRPIPENIPEIEDHLYTMEDNPYHLKQLHIARIGDQLELLWRYEHYCSHRLRFDFFKPIHTRDVFVKDLSLHDQEVFTYAFWQDRNTLKLVLLYIETPYEVTYTVIFSERSIGLHFQMNVSLGLGEYAADGYLLA